MLRTPFASERIQMIDPRTGVKVIQLTSFPSQSAHFKYVWPSITPDNKRVLLFCQRENRREAPWDIFRCDTDGLNLFQLTERGDVCEEGGYYGRPATAMKLDGTATYVVWDKLLCEVDVETGEITELLSLEDACPEESVISEILITSSGKRLFITWGIRRQGAEPGNIRVDLEKRTAEGIDLGGLASFTARDVPRVVVKRGYAVGELITTAEGVRVHKETTNEWSFWSVDEDGGDARLITPQVFAHWTLLGGGTDMQGPGLPPHRCIWIGSEGKEPRKLCQGPYFWHSGPSLDGEWIVSDTNWPDQGLQLIHVPTGNLRTLCYTGASLDAVEYGHPHPFLSNDGRIAIFRSDRTHVCQVYAVHIPDEFRESIIAGDLDQVKDKWI